MVYFGLYLTVFLVGCFVLTFMLLNDLCVWIISPAFIVQNKAFTAHVWLDDRSTIPYWRCQKPSLNLFRISVNFMLCHLFSRCWFSVFSFLSYRISNFRATSTIPGFQTVHHTTFGSASYRCWFPLRRFSWYTSFVLNISSLTQV